MEAALRASWFRFPYASPRRRGDPRDGHDDLPPAVTDHRRDRQFPKAVRVFLKRLDWVTFWDGKRKAIFP